MTEIGAFEAKNQFSQLLDRARRGEEFTITHRGVAIARLGPVSSGLDATDTRRAFARLRRHAGEHLGPPISTEEILDWTAVGRR